MLWHEEVLIYEHDGNRFIKEYHRWILEITYTINNGKVHNGSCIIFLIKGLLNDPCR